MKYIHYIIMITTCFCSLAYSSQLNSFDRFKSENYHIQEKHHVYINNHPNHNINRDHQHDQRRKGIPGKFSKKNQQKFYEKINKEMKKIAHAKFFVNHGDEESFYQEYIQQFTETNHFFFKENFIKQAIDQIFSDIYIENNLLFNPKKYTSKIDFVVALIRRLSNKGIYTSKYIKGLDGKYYLRIGKMGAKQIYLQCREIFQYVKKENQKIGEYQQRLVYCSFKTQSQIENILPYQINSNNLSNQPKKLYWKITIYLLADDDRSYMVVKKLDDYEYYITKLVLCYGQKIEEKPTIGPDDLNVDLYKVRIAQCHSETKKKHYIVYIPDFDKLIPKNKQKELPNLTPLFLFKVITDKHKRPIKYKKLTRVQLQAYHPHARWIYLRLFYITSRLMEGDRRPYDEYIKEVKGQNNPYGGGYNYSPYPLSSHSYYQDQVISSLPYDASYHNYYYNPDYPCYTGNVASNYPTTTYPTYYNYDASNNSPLNPFDYYIKGNDEI